MRQFAVALAFSVATMTAQEPARSGGPLRPLALPMLEDAQPCPITAGTNAVPPSPRIFGGPFWWGSSPAYVGLLWTNGDRGRFSLAPIPIENGMRRAKTAFVADPSYSGVIEVRGGSPALASVCALVPERARTGPARQATVDARVHGRV